GLLRVGGGQRPRRSAPCVGPRASPALVAQPGPCRAAGRPPGHDGVGPSRATRDRHRGGAVERVAGGTRPPELESARDPPRGASPPVSTAAVPYGPRRRPPCARPAAAHRPCADPTRERR